VLVEERPLRAAHNVRINGGLQPLP
jgi:hypothetical protein